MKSWSLPELGVICMTAEQCRILPTALSDRSLLDAAVRSPKNGVEM
jgi:hypothetical protein